MNKIEEQINKFEKIKKKIPITDIATLTKANENHSFTFLSYFFEKKNNSSNKNSAKNIFTPSPNRQENSTEQRQKEKKKFTLIRQDEKGKSRTQQGKNHGNNNEQNNKANASKDFDSSVGHINLLFIENHNIQRSELRKRFEKKREEEEEKTIKEKKINQEQEAGNEEKQQEKEKEKEKEKEIEKVDEEKDNMSIDEDDKEKKEDPKEKEIKIENPNLNNLIRMESDIVIPQNFNIFDDYLLRQEEFDKDDHDQNDINEERNKDTYNKNNGNNEEKNNNIKEENIEKEKEEVEKKEEVKMPNTNENNTNNNFKICIQLEEEGEKEIKEKKEKKDYKEKKEIKSNLTKKNNIPEKLLQNKTKRKNSHEIKKNTNNINKTEDNYNSQKKIPYKNKGKLILDDEDEEEFKNTNDIFSKKKEKEEKEEKGEPIIKTEGNKIKLFLDNDDIKTTKENDINDKNNEINKKNIQSSDKKTNNESELNKKNKNNKTLINKNKSGSQNTTQKINNINNNYDLSCLNNIHGILIQMQEKLTKKNIEKDDFKKCFELIDKIRKSEIYINNSSERKKDTYLCVYNILRKLFIYLSKKNISENFNNEMVAILTNIEKFYESVKKNDNIINNTEFYSKRKLTFKYVFSKLELKNFRKENLKELYINKNDNNDNNTKNYEISDNNKATKFIKTFKRYIKTSKELNREIITFKKKLNSLTQTTKIKEFLEKYESCAAYIQMSPHLMSYKQLFSHFGLILSYWTDSKNKSLLAEIEKQQKKKENNNNLNDIKRKGKSVQVNKNGFKEKRDMSMANIKMKNIK